MEGHVQGIAGRNWQESLGNAALASLCLWYLCAAAFRAYVFHMSLSPYHIVEAGTIFY